MERRRPPRRIPRYDRKRMPITPAIHPIDAALRERLRALKPNQKDLAKRIGRSQGWLNKFMNGAGKATLDDMIRLTAIVVLGVDNPPLTAAQRKFLSAWDALPLKGRRAVWQYLVVWRAGHLQLKSKSSVRAEQKTPGTSGRSPGTR